MHTLVPNHPILSHSTS